MSTEDLTTSYQARYERILQPVAFKLQNHLASHLSDCKRIDRITTRAKSPERFLQKAAKKENGLVKYDEPLSQIQDQIGARVVTFYLPDVKLVASEIERYFRPVEMKSIVPDSDSEFGYFGKHYILVTPPDVTYGYSQPFTPPFFELQIKTLFQQAWSEAEHDLGYKPDSKLTPEQRRKMAFTAAQAWGADLLFEQLLDELTNARPIK